MRHPWTDRGLVAAFGVAVTGALLARPLSGVWVVVIATAALAALRVGVVHPSARLVAVLAVGLLTSTWAADELRTIEQAPLGPWRGVATLRTDPDRSGAGVRAVVELDGFRYEAWAWGLAARSLERRLAGEQVVVSGERRRVEGIRRSALVARHIVGRFDVELAVGAGPGVATARAANRVHRSVAQVGDGWSPDRRALLSGLVLGNDAALSPSAVEAFRTSGLSHLTAVSGQNVALLLTLATPLLARAGRGLRWTLTVVVIAWFAALTRFEPSVLRASAMALFGATATVLGRDRRPVRLLALAGTALLLVDPLLARSVSFWLSMSATTGLLVATPSLLRVLDRWQGAHGGTARQAVSAALATTAGAQVGVLAVSTVVFGLPSSVSLLTNLLAVPPAGVVMVSGPALAVMGAVAPDAARWMARPWEWLVWWITGVAQVGSRLAPPRAVDVVVWTTVVGLTLWGAWHRRRGR